MKELKDNHTIEQACDFYMHTPKYAALSSRSQYDYNLNLKHACVTKVQNNKVLGNIKLKDVRFKHITVAYDLWLNGKGIRQANYIATCLGIVFNTSIRHEAMLSNPITLLSRSKPKARKVKWTEVQVKTFLDTAYSNWEWRSIGLIVHMAYEWAQRVGDMRLLTWNNLDLDEQRLDLEQSKRRADVHLPISDALCKMLVQQHKDFGFQAYVAPRPEPYNGAYTSYHSTDIHKLVNEVKDSAGLPKELTALDLRRTGITEMVEAGVDTLGIMQVSGHSNPQSVKPYLVNTLKGASTALNKRNNDK
tara:strand:+ start:366 stop:1277 length:912 start_codon:yes stop_codon:yes gene_type:complete